MLVFQSLAKKYFLLLGLLNLIPMINKRNRVNHVSISPFYNKFQRVPSESDGVLTSKGEFVSYSAIEKVYSSEFSLGNLIAIGAAGNLSYVSMSVNSDMNFVDEFALSYNQLKTDVTQTN